MIWVDVGWALKGPFFLFSPFCPLWNVLKGLTDSKRISVAHDSDLGLVPASLSLCRFFGDSRQKGKKQNKTECKVVLHAASLGAGRWSGNLADL